jgi:Metallo-beta-lactamase superfamily
MHDHAFVPRLGHTAGLQLPTARGGQSTKTIGGPNDEFSRRHALLGASAIASSAAMQGLHIPSAPAKAPLSNQQAPYFYRFNHGKMQVPLPLGDPSGAFLGTIKEDIGKMLTDNFLNPTNSVLEQNAVVVNTGDKLVLIDTGMGSSAMFGPTTGKLLKSLAAAGIDPKDIDASSSSRTGRSSYPAFRPLPLPAIQSS